MARPKRHSMLEETPDEAWTPTMLECVDTPRTEKVKRVRMAEEKNGWIKVIELTDFMCHRHLKVQLTSSINFITGNNGSGKSAILTALTVCLGGRASTTQRASTLSSLIREGAEMASVRVTLYNGSEFNPFRPDKYGDAIVIERKFGRQPGQGRYSTWNAAGRLVSERREEISQICDHFSIQVDNPLAVLSQETAKRFLASAKPKELYEFFMKATQLEQLAYDYMFSLERIRTATLRIDGIKSTWGEKEGRVKQLETLLSDVARQKDIRRAIKDIKSQMAWSVLEADEKAVQQLQIELEQKQAKIEECEKNRQGKLQRAAHIQEETTGLQKQYAELDQELAPLRQTHNDLLRELQKCKDEMAQIKAQEREARQNWKQESTILKDLEGRLEEELARGDNQNQIRLAEEIRGVEDAIAKAVATVAEGRTKADQIRQKRTELNSMLARAKETQAEIQQRYNQRRHQLEQIKRAQGNKLAGFGERMPALIQEIQEATKAGRFHRKPVGPVGMFVEMRDVKWSKPIEALIGKELESFIVKDQHDHDLLRGMLRRHGLGHSPITLLKDDSPIDYQAGEPDSRFITALRTLKIDHPLVLKALIIQTGIERAVFMPDRDAAKQVLRSHERNVDSAFTPTSRVFVSGASHSNVALYGTNKIHLIRDSNVGIDELQNQVRDIQAELTTCQRDVSRIEEQVSNLSTEISNHDRAFYAAESKERELKSRLKSLEFERAGLATDNVSMDALEQEKRQLESALEAIANQIRFMATQLEALKEQAGQISDRIEANNAEQESLRDKASEIQDSLQAAATFRRDVDKDVRVLEQNLSYHQSEADLKRSKISKMETDLAEATQTLTKISPRVPVTQPRSDLERELTRNEALLEELVRTQPDPEALLTEITGLKDELALSRRQVEGEDALMRKLKMSIERREKIWNEWRKEIAKLSNMEFILMLQARGFEGRLDYDTKAMELNIRVKPQAQVVSDAIAKNKETTEESSVEHRDIRQLSGGEKSYSTACFLFSLWTAMSSPLRALDEFDVFMDQVNRDFVIQELVKNARSSRVQFILITPNAIWNSVQFASDMKVIRLPDPDRRQTTIQA